MKKVRLAAGAVGLAPLIGMMMPSAAVASPQRASGGAALKTKTLALHPLKSAVPAAGCTGGNFVSKYDSHAGIRLWFWFTTYDTGSTCIGTVEGSTQAPAYGSLRWRVRIWHGNTLEYSHVQNSSNPLPIVGVHRAFPDVVGVCSAWLWKGTTTIAEGPNCIDVG